MKQLTSLIFLLLLLTNSYIGVSQCSVMPTAGTTTLSTANFIANSYYPGAGGATCTPGATSTTVGTINAAGNASTIVAGDLVVLIQMQGADINTTNSDQYGDGSGVGTVPIATTTSATGYTNANSVGYYEYANVASVSGTTINFSAPLKYGYCNQNYTATTAIRRYQVVKVPKYYDLTVSAALTGAPWNGTSGGVVILEVANTFNLTGSINMNGKGFRGGAGINYGGNNTFANTDVRTMSTSTLNASKGEGIAGTPRYIFDEPTAARVDNTAEGYINGSFGRGAPGNAGGGSTDGSPSDNSHNCGGGGGANAGVGGKGGNSWSSLLTVGGDGGSPFAQRALGRVIMGGGGGSGNANNSTAAQEASLSGATGGGIIIIKAKSFTGTGALTSNGSNAIGIQAGANNTDGGGGGGAGGSIVLAATTVCGGNIGYTISATGGNGGNALAYYEHGPGGGGGGGFVLSSCTVTTAPNVNGGISGLTYTTSANTATQKFGATDGGVGVGNTGFGPIATTTTNNVPTLGCGNIEVSNPPVSSNIASSPIANNAGATSIAPLVGADADGTIASYSLSSVPTAAQGTLTAVIGGVVTVLAAGQVLTPAQMATLKFTPNPTFIGTATFNYTSTDNTGLVSNTASYAIPVTNKPPTAANVLNTAITSYNDATIVQGLNGSDVDGTVTSYNITSLPPASTGTYFYCPNGVGACTQAQLIPLAVGTPLTPAQAASLYFYPAITGAGTTATLTYTSVDNNGQISTPATYSTPILANTPPVAQNITAPAMSNNNAATSIPNLVATDANGTIATYTIATIPASGTLTAVVGGVTTTITAGTVLTPAQMATLQYDPLPGTPVGNQTFTYFATDNQNTVSNTATYTLPITNNPPVANTVVNPTVPNTGAIAAVAAPLSGTDADGTIASYNITTVPPSSTGVYFYCATGTLPSCTPVAINGPITLTAAQAATLQFDPATTGTGLNATLTFNVVDNNGNVSTTPATYTTPVGTPPANPAPVAQNLANTPINTGSGFANINPPSATDANGTIASYNINAPSCGVLQYKVGGVGAAYTVIATYPITLTPAERATLQFSPASGTPCAAGTTASFTYTATDNLGAVSNTATVTIPIRANTPPIANNVVNNPVGPNPPATPAAPLTASDADGTIASYQILSLPPASSGIYYYCPNGAGACTQAQLVALVVGTPLTPAQAASIYFDPAVTGGGTTATLTFTATDNSGAVSSVGSYSTPISNLPPNAQNLVSTPIPNTNGATTLPGLVGTDVDGTIANYNITSLPVSGTLSLNGTAVTIGQSLTVAQASQLVYTPATGGVTPVGNQTFNYTTTDNSGAVSNTASVTIPITNTPPVANPTITNPVVVGSGAAAIPALSGSDVQGIITGYRITTMPTCGTLTYVIGGVTTTITAASLPLNLTPAQAATIQFNPSTGSTVCAAGASSTFNFVSIDNNGQASLPAPYTIPIVTATNPILPVGTPPVANNLTAGAYASSNGTAQNLGNLVNGVVTGSVPLSATAGSSAVTNFLISSLPPTSQGVLSIGGVPLTVGQSLTPAQAASIQFTPAANYQGPVTFNYAAVDANGNTSAPATYTILVVDPAPIATNTTSLTIIKSTAIANNIPALTGSDNGNTIAATTSITNYTVSSMPPASQGTVTAVIGGVVTTLAVGTVLTPAQAATLQFTPNPTYTGTAFVFNYTATDNLGQVSSPAVYTIPLSGGALLPVSLLSFTATKEGNNSQLKWATTREINTKYIVIERSSNGVTFNILTTLNAQGNSNNIQNYNYLDMATNTGVNYYRLKIIDINGAITYSDIRKVNFAKVIKIDAYPNPVTNYVMVTLPDTWLGKKVQFILVNTIGQQLNTKIIVNAIQTERLQTDNLAKGIYMLQANNIDNGEKAVLKIIVE